MTKEKYKAQEENRFASISENRIQQNKSRRRAERRKHIQIFVLTVFLVSVLSLTIGSFLSNAKSSSGDIRYKYYKSIVIMQGDSLWSIASANKPEEQTLETYLAEIQQMNGLSNDTIHAGNYLIVPYYANEFIK